MRCIIAIWALVFFTRVQDAVAQVSADCDNAVPICNNTPVNGGTNGFGLDDFNGTPTSGCLEEALAGAIESNSAWYRFRTGASGQLGINIGIDTDEDWDFALYQTSDCTDLGNPVRCNFFDNQDQNGFIGIGEDPSGDTDNVQYEDWLQVEPGEDYYLLINNFSNNNSGFSIQFSGQIFVTNPYDALDCSIIDNLLGPPISACENDTVVLNATTVNATNYEWFMDSGSGFQLISGETGPTLQVTQSALYRVRVSLPSGSSIISEVQVAFSALPMAFPVSHDAICSDSGAYTLSQKNGEVLGSQDPQEFRVGYYASYSDAVNGLNVLPEQYIPGIGAQTIYVRVSSLENPRCFDVSQQFQLTVLQTPVLDFPSEVEICEDNSGIVIGDPFPNTAFHYLWDSGETTSSIIVSQEGVYTLTATNSQNGENCTSSSTVTVRVSRPPEITDVIIEDLQNENSVTVITQVEGDFEYRLDDGAYQPTNVFTDVLPGMHAVTVNNRLGCGSVTENIVVVGFPKFFTPNGDNINDDWHIIGMLNLRDPVVSIFDRFGKLLKSLDSNSTHWDGRFNGREVPSSDYWFKLTYMDDNGQLTTAKYINNHFSLRR
ncbi:T9SS type B sorting domain-containing protein [Ulvibacterium sp.]|uniref:T9SS type B sorting domain-containing protein n=1 Tax=Ulvibacterium sp. TaxID=2665914 RepID=UPI0026063F9F|nr:T9SS type B sorting domain-containing protein [Ulvibacterium sp.]